MLGDGNALGFNSFTLNDDGKQTNLEPLPQLPNLTGTATFINWINEKGLTAGFGTRMDAASGAPLDHPAIWTADGHIFTLPTPDFDQSPAVWINDHGVASGWIANATPEPCAFGLGLQDKSPGGHLAIWRHDPPWELWAAPTAMEGS